jgi:hypothetical protein
LSQRRLFGAHHPSHGRRVFRLLLSSLAVALVVNLLPGVAVAAPLPASLLGENLDVASLTGTGSATCTSVDGSRPGFRGSGSETFNLSGNASGPYPGTFIAQGTISVSADATTFNINETFTITSVAGTVNGIKQGTAIPTGAYTTPQTGNVVCQVITNELGVVVPSLMFTTLQVVPWSATIHPATGTYIDSGHGSLLVYTGLFGAPNGSTPGVIVYHPAFSEQFQTSNGVKASPTMTTQATACCTPGSGSTFLIGAGTTAGGALADTATLSGGSAPTGTIRFGLFGPDNANCGGTAVFTSTKTVTGNSSYSSDPYTAVLGGTYRWVASYSGDPTNNPVVGTCNASGESSTVTACPLSLAGPAPCGEQFASATTPFLPPAFPPGFGGSATVTSKTCGPDGTGSLGFTADGTATGPYPGIFHEAGTIVLAGTHVTRADAQFSITSPTGNVSGTKSFNISAPASNSAGNCNFEPLFIDPGMFLNFQSQQQQTYQATITTALGRFSDSGTGGSTFSTSFQGATLSPPFVNAFTEGFSFSNGVVPLNDTDLGLTGVPANITVNATSSAGAVVTYVLPTAVDEPGDIPAPTVSCTRASGSIFPIGTTTVTCTAFSDDDTPSTVSQSFTVTVNDTDLGLTGVPANITVNATSSAGAVVTYAMPTAVDEAGDIPAPMVSCTPASGSTFPIGTTTVTCIATSADDTPSTLNRSFTVTVNDTDLGLTSVPANIMIDVNSPLGAVVTYALPTAVDEAGDIPAPTVSCTPASGSTFALGITTVTCTATSVDDTPSTVSGTFTVTVVASPAGISNVVGQLLAAGCIDNAGIANALTAKLTAAQNAIGAGNNKEAINILRAFIHQVQAQSGKHIVASCTMAGVTFDPAAVLIVDARSIIDALPSLEG